MNPTGNQPRAQSNADDRGEEIIGLLQAISVVSRRLASRLSTLQRQQASVYSEGGNPSEQNKRTCPCNQ